MPSYSTIEYALANPDNLVHVMVEPLHAKVAAEVFGQHLFFHAPPSSAPLHNFRCFVSKTEGVFRAASEANSRLVDDWIERHPGKESTREAHETYEVLREMWDIEFTDYLRNHIVPRFSAERFRRMVY